MNYIKNLEDKRDQMRECLIQVRIDEKLTLKKLAGEIGITIPTLNTFLRGMTKPYFVNLCKIKDFLESKGIVI